MSLIRDVEELAAHAAAQLPPDETAPPPHPLPPTVVGGGAHHEPWESWGIASRWNPVLGWHFPNDY